MSCCGGNSNNVRPTIVSPPPKPKPTPTPPPPIATLAVLSPKKNVATPQELNLSDVPAVVSRSNSKDVGAFYDAESFRCSFPNDNDSAAVSRNNSNIPTINVFYDAESFSRTVSAIPTSAVQRSSSQDGLKFYDARSFRDTNASLVSPDLTFQKCGTNESLVEAPLVRQISDTNVHPYPCPLKLTGPIVISKGRKYRTFCVPDFLAFRKLADSCGPTWTSRYSAKDKSCFSWDQPPPPKTSSFNLVKVFAIFPDIPGLLMYDVLHDPIYRKLWDEGMIKGYNICQLNKNNDIGYYCVKTPSPSSNRDFCNQRAWIMTNSDEMIILNTSVEHADQPKVSGVVRGFSYISGYMIRPLKGNDSGCSMTYLSCSDPGGWLPSSLMNQITAKFAPQLMTKLHHAARAYPPWKAKNNPDHKPWLVPRDDWPTPVDNQTPDWWGRQ